MLKNEEDWYDSKCLEMPKISYLDNSLILGELILYTLNTINFILYQKKIKNIFQMCLRINIEEYSNFLMMRAKLITQQISFKIL